MENIVAYTDGSCLGNPGFSGLGAVIKIDSQEKELCEHLGLGTNNIAELTAVLRVLQATKIYERSIDIYTDSKYTIGVCSGDYNAKKNKKLIIKIKNLMKEFPKVNFHWVKGHNGDPLNERANTLAQEAAENSIEM